MNAHRLLVASACAVLCGVACAAGLPSARSDDFDALLVLTPDPQAFARMWAKTSPPNLREYRTAEVGTTVTAIVMYSGGKPGADGNCDLVYRVGIAHADGSPPPPSASAPLCAGRAPGARGAHAIGEAMMGIGTSGEPRDVTVVATITDRVTGKSVEITAPLTLVGAGTLFHFESVRSLDDMRSLIRARFPLGAERAAVRRAFVQEGRAALYTHPTQPGVEKYVYDIDLCSYYVWRWNVSADFDERGLLRQAYVNGDIVFPGGTPKRIVPKGPSAPGKTASIARATRPRPEATKGERSLDYILFDGDSDPRTMDDRAAVGAGPTRVDPIEMGQLYVYSDVDPWRSIFDVDPAEPIATYAGDCAAADARFEAQGRRVGTPTKDVADRMVRAMQENREKPGQEKPR